MKNLGLFFTFFYLITACLLQSTLCAADNPPADNTESPAPYFRDWSPDVPPPANDNFFYEFAKMIFMLGIVIGLLMLVMWVLKRMMNARFEQLSEGDNIHVVERRYLSQYTTLYVIDLPGKRIVCAESHHQTTLLAELPLTD